AVCSCLLPESLQVTAAKQIPEYHDCDEDGTVSVSSSNSQEEPLEFFDDADQDKHLLSTPTPESSETRKPYFASIGLAEGGTITLANRRASVEAPRSCHLGVLFLLEALAPQKLELRLGELDCVLTDSLITA
nr:hypothetical protein [Tanacetum cinerariifolium]